MWPAPQPFKVSSLPAETDRTGLHGFPQPSHGHGHRLYKRFGPNLRAELRAANRDSPVETGRNP